MEATVDDVKAVRDAAVTGESEHHAGIGSLERVSAVHLIAVPRRHQARVRARGGSDVPS